MGHRAIESLDRNYGAWLAGMAASSFLTQRSAGADSRVQWLNDAMNQWLDLEFPANLLLNTPPMTTRYRFIALEGIDGAGKRTQLDLLKKLLLRKRVPCVRFAFPNYSSFFGQMVGSFLDGQFGSLAEVDPHFSALLYAGDRLENKEKLKRALESGKVVITDRYIGSNLAHQTARVPRKDRRAFLAWLRELEYEVYGLPVETAVVYLRVPPRAAQGQVAKKAKRNYTRKRHDLQEADLRHLEEAAAVYDQLARSNKNWVRVECFDRRRQQMKRPEQIHGEVVAALAGLNSGLLAK